MFEPHGYFHLEVDGNVIVSWCRGAWNVQQAQAYTNEFVDIVESFNGAPFCSIVVADKTSIATPDAIKYIRQLVQSNEDNGCLMFGVVSEWKIIRGIMMMVHAGLTAPTFFDTVPEAKQYANELLSQSNTA